MRFSTSAFLAIASTPLLALAQDSNGSNPFNIPTTSLNTEAGETVKLTWKPTTEGTVTILLRSGASNDLNKGTAIASNIDNNGAFTWNVPSDIVRGSNYALEIVDDADDSNTNYTPPFVIESDNNAAPIPSSSSMASSPSSSMASSTESSMTSSETDSMSMSMTSSMMSSMTSGTAAMASSASHHAASGNSTASMTTSSSTRGSTSAPTGDAQDVQESEGGAASMRTSTFAGLLGLVALGALAL